MSISKITSLTNPRIKRIVQLRKSKVRSAEGVMIVEGEREILRALEAKVNFREMYVSKSKNEITTPRGRNLIKLKASVYETTQSVFSKIAYGQKEEGILAVCEIPRYSFSDFKNVKSPLFVIIEGIEKPGNLGAILRTCDGAGVTGVIVCDKKTDVYNPNVIRASLGTIFSVKVVAATNEEALKFLRSQNVSICATLSQAKMGYTKANLNQPFAVVMGSEEKGLSNFWSQQADLCVRIPMKGKADSLNVSASAAIVLYEAIRQREK